jgi:GTP 3',8-cyclase
MIRLGHLDLNICTHCNNRCVACSHASPFTKAYHMKPAVLERDLEAIKPFLSFARLQLVGGEPLLHPNITDMLYVARCSGVGDQVMVITNGKLLPRMPDKFWELLGILQISVYPGLDPAILDLAYAKGKELGFGVAHTVFTDFYLQFSKEPTDGQESFKNCIWKADCYTLHEGRFFLCPQSAFFPHQFQHLEAGVDGLPIVDCLTEGILSDFLQRETPFNACKICCGGHGQTVPWQEPKTKEEWLKLSTLT